MKAEHESLNYSGVYKDDSRNHGSPPDFNHIEKYFTGNLPEFNTTLPFKACLIDSSGRQFVCTHEHCSEFSNCFKNEMAHEVFNFQALHFHPDDKTLLCDKIFPDILKYMKEIPSKELQDYRFSFNHRYIHKDGSISQFLQEGTLTKPDDESTPALNLNVFTEIGELKTDETMILTIFHYSVDQGYQKIHSKVYCETSTQLSQREIEIIKLCHNGLSSKMIADKLNLSIHTVKNHKRNCMEKTCTHNITELINLCMKNHWF
jgi:DNA-binding CsgD family transcriptional regulator